jgi:hypothetical protein
MSLKNFDIMILWIVKFKSRGLTNNIEGTEYDFTYNAVDYIISVFSACTERSDALSNSRGIEVSPW